jgi:hypothetical protein
VKGLDGPYASPANEANWQKLNRLLETKSGFVTMADL